jgi:hypothetical protein
MAFKVEGHFKGKVLDVMLAEPQFAREDPDAFDVCIQVQGPDGQSDWWRGEMSGAYGKGNAATKTQKELTLESLGKIGFHGNDLTKLANLVGREIEYSVVAREYTAKDGTKKTAFDVRYLGPNEFGPKRLDANSLAAKMRAMGFAAPSAPGAPAQATRAAPADPAQAAAAVAEDWC